MYVDLVMKENEATLEKSGWSLSMYVRARLVGVYVCSPMEANIHVC